MASQLMGRFDIIINGGGIVGFTLLNLLSKSPSLRNAKILLLEQASKPSSFVQPPSDEYDTSESRSFSNRVSSISKSSRDTLEKIGIWEKVEPFSKDIHKIKVWNYNYSNHLELDPTEHGKFVFTIMENNRLNLTLIKGLENLPQSQVSWNTTLEGLTASTEGKLIEVRARKENNQEYIATAPLILGCDGFRSTVRKIANINYKECDLKQSAVVGTVRMGPDYSDEPSENDVAYQRFTSDKVIAILPLDGEHSSFVISAPNEYANHLMELSDEEFIDAFNSLLQGPEAPSNPILNSMHGFANLIRNQVLELKNIGKTLIPEQFSIINQGNPPCVESLVKDSRAKYALYFGTTTPKMTAKFSQRQYSQIALLGDSAHRIHPLAGQGLNLGIKDASELVDQLENVARTGENIFNNNDQYFIDKALKRYEWNRQKYLMPMQLAIWFLPRCFHMLPEQILTGINKLSRFKEMSVRYANGCY